jgi:ribosomal protein L18
MNSNYTSAKQWLIYRGYVQRYHVNTTDQSTPISTHFCFFKLCNHFIYIQISHEKQNKPVVLSHTCRCVVDQHKWKLQSAGTSILLCYNIAKKKLEETMCQARRCVKTMLINFAFLCSFVSVLMKIYTIICCW